MHRVGIVSCRLFGGMIADIKRRYRLYKSDIIDGLNPQCLASIIFLYFACITPIVTFGGLMSQKTGQYLVGPVKLFHNLGRLKVQDVKMTDHRNRKG